MDNVISFPFEEVNKVSPMEMILTSVGVSDKANTSRLLPLLGVNDWWQLPTTFDELKKSKLGKLKMKDVHPKDRGDLAKFLEQLS